MTSSRKPIVLTIAGFDPSSGAGITADLQVFAAHGLFGTSAITALTVQSTMGVAAVEPTTASLLRRTLQRLVEDLPPSGIKIGMLGSAELVREVAKFLGSLSDIGIGRIPVVLDPVITSSSGKLLLEGGALEVLCDELLPLVSWVTPNQAELALLSGGGLDVSASLNELAARFPDLDVVATGGDAAGTPIDRWKSKGRQVRDFRGNRVETTSTHGTGCAFSSALLSNLVLGLEPDNAIRTAKEYVEGALRHAPGLGRGAGPLNFFWRRSGC